MFLWNFKFSIFSCFHQFWCLYGKSLLFSPRGRKNDIELPHQINSKMPFDNFISKNQFDNFITNLWFYFKKWYLKIFESLDFCLNVLSSFYFLRFFCKKNIWTSFRHISGFFKNFFKVLICSKLCLKNSKLLKKNPNLKKKLWTNKSWEKMTA